VLRDWLKPLSLRERVTLYPRLLREGRGSVWLLKCSGAYCDKGFYNSDATHMHARYLPMGARAAFVKHAVRKAGLRAA
jgi:hypothetical protein